MSTLEDLKNRKEGELSDDELTKVAGGKGDPEAKFQEGDFITSSSFFSDFGNCFAYKVTHLKLKKHIMYYGVKVCMYDKNTKTYSSYDVNDITSETIDNYYKIDFPYASYFSD